VTRVDWQHDGNCAWPNGEPCRKFSTDGTRLGAEIAHTMGTTDEEEIIRRETERIRSEELTGMPEEQAEWDAPTIGQGHLSECAVSVYPGLGYNCTCYDWSPE
jgi:hypothetical protein